MRIWRAMRSSSVSTTCGGHVDHGMNVMVKNIAFNSMIYSRLGRFSQKVRHFAKGQCCPDAERDR